METMKPSYSISFKIYNGKVIILDATEVYKCVLLLAVNVAKHKKLFVENSTLTQEHNIDLDIYVG